MLHLGVGQAGCQLSASLWQLAERDPFICEEAANAHAPSEPEHDRPGGEESSPPEWDGTIAPLDPDEGEDARSGGADEGRRSESMFDRRFAARCLLVDSETKAVRSAMRPADERSAWGEARAGGRGTAAAARSLMPRLSCLVPDWNTVTDRHGRENCWAAGYMHVEARDRQGAAAWDSAEERSVGPLWERAGELIRRRLEVAGTPGRRDGGFAFCMLHSTGGGTGSGLGSRVVEALADAYPRATRLAVSVLPFESGGSPLQCYNAALALRSVHEHCDAVVWAANDDLMELSAQAMAGAGGGAAGGGAAAARTGGGGLSGAGWAGLSLADMNDVLTQSLAGALWPVLTSSSSSSSGSGGGGGGGSGGAGDGPASPGAGAGGLVPFNATEFAEQLCPTPRLNFVSVYASHAAPVAGRARRGAGRPAGGLPASLVSPLARPEDRVATAVAMREACLGLLRVPPPEYVPCEAARLTPGVASGGVRGGGGRGLTAAAASAVSWGWLARGVGRGLRTTDRGSTGDRAAWSAARVWVRGVTGAELAPAGAAAAERRPGRSAGGVTPVSMGRMVRRGAAATASKRGARDAGSAGAGLWGDLPEGAGAADWAQCRKALEAAVPRRQAQQQGAAARFRQDVRSSVVTSRAPLALAAGVRRSVTLACNSSSIVPRVGLIAETAHAKLSVGAYVHWLERHGVEGELVVEAVESLRASMGLYAEL